MVARNNLGKWSFYFVAIFILAVGCGIGISIYFRLPIYVSGSLGAIFGVLGGLLLKKLEKGL